MSPPKMVKLPVEQQCCYNCAFSRWAPHKSANKRRSEGTDLECRWEGPPWDDKGVLDTDWCRRWAAHKPSPKPVVKEPDNG